MATVINFTDGAEITEEVVVVAAAEKYLDVRF